MRNIYSSGVQTGP